MFPVRMILCQIEGLPLPQREIDELFSADVRRLGEGKFHGVMTMTAGRAGTGTFYQYFFEPATALQLAFLIEYSEECRHGFVVVIVRDTKSYFLPTPLSFSNDGDWLDAASSPIDHCLASANNVDDFLLQQGIVEDWSKMREYIESIELENRMLRARLGDTSNK